MHPWLNYAFKWVLGAFDSCHFLKLLQVLLIQFGLILVKSAAHHLYHQK
jgi:hypothetical protein